MEKETRPFAELMRLVQEYLDDPPVPPDRLCTCGWQPDGTFVQECDADKAWRGVLKAEEEPPLEGPLSRARRNDDVEMARQHLERCVKLAQRRARAVAKIAIESPTQAVERRRKRQTLLQRISRARKRLAQLEARAHAKEEVHE